MANYPKELEDLIQEYLTDGIITAKERQVLLNKAASLGLNVDEIDLYIDAQQQKADQQIDEAVRKQRGQTCPFCGGSVPQLADKCPHCGQHISVEASAELTEIIDKLEEALIDLKSGKESEKNKAMVERYVRKAKMYYENNPKVQKLLVEIQAETEKADMTVKKNARKKAIVTFVSNHKWITIIVIIVLIGAIYAGISSLNKAIKGPDPTEEPEICVEAIKKAISNDDIVEAESIFAKYYAKHGLSHIGTGVASITDYYFENGNLDKVATYIEKMFGSDEKVYKERLQNAYIELGEYEKAESFKGKSGIYKSDIPFFSKVVKHMKKSGMSKNEIKAYIEGVIARTYEYDKSEMRTALEALNQ